MSQLKFQSIVDMEIVVLLLNSKIVLEFFPKQAAHNNVPSIIVDQYTIITIILS